MTMATANSRGTILQGRMDDNLGVRKRLSKHNM
jgi:hypothetical protein